MVEILLVKISAQTLIHCCHNIYFNPHVLISINNQMNFSSLFSFSTHDELFSNVTWMLILQQFLPCFLLNKHLQNCILLMHLVPGYFFRKWLISHLFATIEHSSVLHCVPALILHEIGVRDAALPTTLKIETQPTAGSQSELAHFF